VRFVARKPREGINVGPWHPLKETAFLIAVVVSVGTLLLVGAGFLAEAVSVHVPPDVEQEIFAPYGLAVERMERGEPRRDLTKILLRLSRHWKENPYPVRVAVVQDDRENAVSLPGGGILITSSLLQMLDNENELAFVLSHELGHLRARDHLRTLSRLLTYRFLIALTTGRQVGVDLPKLTSRMTEVGFDRRSELAADIFALRLVNAEYGHVAGAIDFPRKLDAREGAAKRLLSYVSTHPAGTARAAVLRAFAKEHGFALHGRLTPWPKPSHQEKTAPNRP